MGDFGAPKDKWVCPNDRELSLRAKLKVGWSVKTNSNNFNKPEQLNDSEQEVIMNVIRRAELLDRVEQERVGRLVERLDNMKRNAMGNGSTQCILCADEFGILGASPLLCNDCRKAVCTKCGVDTVSANKEPLWLCKICAETRETWKKSGAWFYKGLPKYVLPGKKGEQGKYTTTASTPIRGTVDHGGTGSPVRSYNSWMQSKGRSVSERDYTDSSDDEIKTSRLSKKGTMRKQTHGESVDIPDQPQPGQYSVAPSAEATPQGPSPTHMYSLTPELPHSPRSPHKEIAEKSPGYESAPAYGRERRIEPERSIHTSTTTGSYWYKPNARRDNLEEEEYIPTDTSSLRPHPRRDGHHTASPRHRQAASNREGQPYEEKLSPEESSKRQKYFYRGKKRKKI